MIEIRNLTKMYGHKRAVNDISFDVKDGEVLGFLGPNGAGKSTTMNMITGYLSLTSGTIKIDGIDIMENPKEAKKLIGYLPELPPLYLDMTVKEYLNFVYDLKGCKLPRREHLAEICELVKIQDHYGRLIKNLSKGYRQRVGVAQALVGNPKVLILDEPTVGLDPRQIIEIRNLIQTLGKSHTLILSSHILPEVQAVCEKIIVISKGNIVANDTPDNLSHNLSGSNKFLARIGGDFKSALPVLRAIPHVKFADLLGQKEADAADFVIESELGSDVRRPLFEALAGHGYYLLGLKPMELSLEDIFMQLVSDSNELRSDNAHEEEKAV
ncbi:ABC transporter ATP-binding protein [Feifania hominis]|uniref:ATP-binding cassette domain-containing protein n=1 Tax=Feifania hominis TaxID=2763660 RepID=A0A926HVG2_9FIRM|nr:ATP-binding cassette domain-containing protein [Feifania hominis]MBC8536586.1 ATP-binding cassette domain-containing protein [Feifania hominis]